MSGIRIKLKSGGGKREIAGTYGETLLNCLAHAGVYLVDAPCGGMGRCGKCSVKAYGNMRPPDETEIALLGSGISRQMRLACRARVTGDVSLELMNPHTQIAQIETGGYDPDAFDADPYITVENTNGGREVCLFGQPFCRLTKQTVIVGIAIDLGTTTLAAKFFDLESGETLFTAASVNPQRQWGADVISRISACMEQGGLQRLRTCLWNAVNGMIDDFCRNTGNKPEQIVYCTVAGNTVMQHIAAGLPPDGMAAAPFTTASLFGGEYGAGDIGADMNPAGKVFFLPCVSAFIGGDITAGLLCCGFDKSDASALFVDVGTNGEMAVCCGGRITCASVAAGPAFEGAHIACGMAGVEGAINEVNVENDRVEFKTIGGRPPKGICGSGLIDLVATMVKTGALDETGAIVAQADGMERTERFYIGGSGIYVTQQDIREFQLAKSAIAAGIEALTAFTGFRPDQKAVLYLSGGLKVNTMSAKITGLLPGPFCENPVSAGNTSLTGAARVLLSNAERKRVIRLASKCSYLDLSQDAVFKDAFIDHMGFTNTI